MSDSTYTGPSILDLQREIEGLKVELQMVRDLAFYMAGVLNVPTSIVPPEEQEFTEEQKETVEQHINGS